MGIIKIDPSKLPVPDQKLIGVEFAGVMCSATKEDQNGVVAVFLAFKEQGDQFKPTQFVFANGNKLLLSKDNVAQFMSVWTPFRQSFFSPPNEAAQ